jgi:hypothetical protein
MIMLACILATGAFACAPEEGGPDTALPATLQGYCDQRLVQEKRVLGDPFRILDPENEADQEKAQEESGEPSELTLLNFFSEGWNQDWVKRSRKGRTPDMALLRVTTNFLERELRLDYAYTRDVKNSAKVDHTQFLNGLIAYGLNRRFMIEIISNYQWNEPPSGSTAPKENGSGAAALVRFQLTDTYDQCYGFQVRVSAPNRGIGQTATTVSPSLAGFQDLQSLLGLDRVGLYESVTYDSLAGPHATGARTQAVSYDVSLAKTWTDPHSFPVGNFTSFLELFATTDLSGDTKYHTGVTLTPGVRFWFAHENSLTLGVDFPISQPHPFGEVFRITYILNF